MGRSLRTNPPLVHKCTRMSPAGDTALDFPPQNEAGLGQEGRGQQPLTCLLPPPVLQPVIRTWFKCLFCVLGDRDGAEHPSCSLNWGCAHHTHTNTPSGWFRGRCPSSPLVAPHVSLQPCSPGSPVSTASARPHLEGSSLLRKITCCFLTSPGSRRTD